MTQHLCRTKTEASNKIYISRDCIKTTTVSNFLKFRVFLESRIGVSGVNQHEEFIF